MDIFSIAFRNVIRSKHWSLVIISAMAFASFVMIFYASLLEGLIQTTEKNAVGMEIGEFQIHALGYRDDPDLYNRITDVEKIIEEANAAGFYAAPRLYGFGLAAAGSSSAGVRLRGVDLDREPLITEINQHILDGSWLTRDDPEGVVLGRKLAKALGVKVGGEVLIVSQAADGSLANDLFRVRGILKSVGDSVDRGGFFMTDQAFRKLMVIPHGAHEIVVSRKEPGNDLNTATQKLAAMFPKLEVKNWRQLYPVVARVVDLSQHSLIIMLLITYAAVGILTLNAMLMGVFKRIHEFGIMKALGVSPWRIFSLILGETLVQVSVAVVVALLTAVPLSLYFEKHPLDFSGLAKASSSIAGVAMDPVWYCRVTTNSVLMPVVFLYVVAVVAILYPAIKAALIRPIDAIYHR